MKQILFNALVHACRLQVVVANIQLALALLLLFTLFVNHPNFATLYNKIKQTRNGNENKILISCHFF